MSESDWKILRDALDMWRASQVAIRGHVQTVSEAVDRLYDLRKRDSELILRLAKERNDARDLLHGLTNEADANAAWKALILRAEEAEVRVKELEKIIRDHWSPSQADELLG